ncbi:MAG TPA: MFS transporter, partial [Roseiflexaceae bacterium]|nr:MFS transporter [Roseiflexaceae bacterium]
MRLNYARTFLLGCAYLSVQVLFAIYNAYVPIFLQSGRADFSETSPVPGGFGLGAALAGFIMTLDNLAALLILPLIGALSDATTSRLGKRKPYILAGAPIAALAFAIMPFMLGQPLALFMLVVVALVLAVDIIRTPIISLMPDITPSPLRSQANGVINFMGGVGAVLAFLIGGVLYQQSTIAPFLFGAAVLLVGCLLVVVLVPVPAQGDTAYGAGQGRRPLRHAIRDQLSAFQDLHAARRQGDRSLLALLGAIFCLFLAYSALTVFFTSFALDSLRVARGQESQLLTFFALAIVVFALPTGLISARIGRRRATLGGVLTLAAALAMIGLATDLAMIRGLLILAGAGWALITVNALPMVLDSAPPDRLEQIGIYTGIYFLATQSAEVIGPVLVGGFLDLTGRNYRFIFAYTLIVLAAALAMLLVVRRGEARVLAE